MILRHQIAQMTNRITNTLFFFLFCSSYHIHYFLVVFFSHFEYLLDVCTIQMSMNHFFQVMLDSKSTYSALTLRPLIHQTQVLKTRMSTPVQFLARSVISSTLIILFLGSPMIRMSVLDSTRNGAQQNSMVALYSYKNQLCFSAQCPDIKELSNMFNSKKSSQELFLCVFWQLYSEP